jgi:SPP1 gp7 family putative phage head morphogenesis protein
MNTASLIADSIIARTVDLTIFSNTEIRRRIIPVLQLLRDDLVEQINVMEISGKLEGAEKGIRLRALYEATTQSIKLAYAKLKDRSAVLLSEVAEMESAASAVDINRALQVDLVAPGLSTQMLETLVKSKDSLILGAPANEWWSRQELQLKNAFMDQVRQGVLQSQSTGDIVRRVRGLSTGRSTTITLKSGEKRRIYEFTGGVMDVSTRNAVALVRTSVHSVANATRVEMYKKNDDLIKGYQFLATLDGRTTKICMAHSGGSWDMEGNPLNGTKLRFPGHPPLHYNCRSTLIPLMKSWEELAGPGSEISQTKLQKLDKELTSSTQSSMDGQVAEDLNYEQWLKTKPEEFQRETLGEGRFDLWKSGKIGLAQLIDRNGETLTLAELKSKYT